MTMPLIHFGIALDEQSLGTLEETCPHCNTRQALDRRTLRSVAAFIPLPKSEAFVCPKCAKVSRFEGRASRIFGAVFLMPFGLLLAVCISTGVYFLVSMAFGEFSVPFAAMAVGLVAVAGYLEYLVVRGMRRLLGNPRLLPMQGLMTDL